jgi:hypothetical protein
LKIEIDVNGIVYISLFDQFFYNSFTSIMDIQYVYTKKRSEFGRQVLFSDRPVELIADIQPNLELTREYVARDPVEMGIQNVRELSEHWVRNFQK